MARVFVPHVQDSMVCQNRGAFWGRDLGAAAVARHGTHEPSKAYLRDPLLTSPLHGSCTGPITVTLPQSNELLP